MSLSTPRDYDPLLVQIVDYVFDQTLDSAAEHEALRNARFSLLDALGCAAECLATSSDAHQLIGPWVPGTTVPDGFRLPGTDFVLDPVKGAFDLGVLIRYLDHNDGFTGLEWGHPSDNLGAICAVADHISRASKTAQQNGSTKGMKGPTIHTILISLIKAYEIQGRLQLSNSLNARGLDHVFFEQLATCAVICSPLLLNLTTSQTLSALSHCILDNAPLRAYRHAPNTIPRKGWAGGNAASRAVQLALIARTGQPGAPTALSADRWGFEAAVLGKSRGKEVKCADDDEIKRLQFGGPGPGTLDTYVVRNVFYKLMPCEAHALTAVEACIRIRDQLQAEGKVWDARKVQRVNIRTHSGAVLIISKPATLALSNPADRDHCLEYMTAIALIKGAAPEYKDYSDETAHELGEQIDLLRTKVVVTEDENFSRDYLDPEKRSLASGVSITFTDGLEMPEVVIEYPLGNPKHPDTEQAVKAKYCTNLELVYSRSTVEDVINVVERCEDMPAWEFFDKLWKGHA